MRVTFSDGLYRGSYITGPTHTYLGLRFGSATQAGFAVEILPPVGQCTQDAGLTEEEVRPWIEEGLRRASEESGQELHVTYAQAVENDTRSPWVYSELARRLALAFLAADGESADRG